MRSPGERNGQSRIRVICVDDHDVVRAGLAAFINSQEDMELVGDASSGESAVQLYSSERPDVVLLDLHLPGMSGTETMLEILREHSDARVIVFTVYNCDSDVLQAVQAGARGYLLKDSLRKELVEAIRAVNRGERVMSVEISGRLMECYQKPVLTRREHEVLDLMGDGLQNGEIADALKISVETVKLHVKSILEKLDVDNRTKAVAAALHRGIIRRR